LDADRGSFLDRVLDAVAHTRFLGALGVMLAITCVGVIGYRLIEGFSWVDSLYMTVITLSTVGYREVHPLDPAGKLFTVALIVFGIGIVLTIIGAWAHGLLEGELRGYIGRRRMTRMLKRLSDHYIICGYGRFGSRVAEELRGRGIKYVVVDKQKNVTDEMPGIVGDATEDAVLVEAGVERARGLLATLPSDADNLYLTLAAKDLNPSLSIVARCENEANAARLRRAGASRVVLPYAIAGHRMAQAALHPRVLEFVDMVTGARDRKMSLAEVKIGAGSFCDGQSLEEADINARFNVIVVGIFRHDGTVDVRPEPDRMLAAGETLLAFGDEEALERLAKQAGGA
jgi:voltage-gated potassium channel